MLSNNEIEKKSLEKIKQIINESIGKYKPMAESLIESGEKIKRACDEIDKSWSNSFAGYHGRLYFVDFREPPINSRFNTEWGCIRGIPSGWGEKKPEEVKQKIEELVGKNISLTRVEEDEKNIVKELEEIKREILILFSSFELSDKQIQEKELLSKIEGYIFSKKLGHFINKMMPKSIQTRDSRAINEGICLPSHIYDKGVALLIIDTSESVLEFFKLVDRTIRQLEIKSSKEENRIAYWNYVNPFWLFWKLILQFFVLLKFAWRHKIGAIIITVISFLAIDYAILGNNLLKLLNFLKGLI